MLARMAAYWKMAFLSYSLELARAGERKFLAEQSFLMISSISVIASAAIGLLWYWWWKFSAPKLR